MKHADALEFERILQKCPLCGKLAAENAPAPAVPFSPWHVRNQSALKSYVDTLPAETREWVLALYVDQFLNLLSVETLARGSIDGATINIGRLIYRGLSLNAAGYFLVHNHPSGDPTPSQQDINVTRRISRTSADCDIPMLCHLIVAANGMKTVGGW